MRFKASAASVWSLSVVALFLRNSQDCRALPRGTRVAVRFDRVEWAVDSEFGRTDEVYVTQYNGTDFANVALTFDFDFLMTRATVEVIRCKEHYLDCANYRSFELTRFCGNENAVLLFFRIGYVKREVLCTVKKGSYAFKNATVNTDTVVLSFALSLDKWWEKSWMWNVVFFSEDESSPAVMRLSGQLRYLLFRTGRRLRQ